MTAKLDWVNVYLAAFLKYKSREGLDVLLPGKRL